MTHTPRDFLAKLGLPETVLTVLDERSGGISANATELQVVRQSIEILTREVSKALYDSTTIDSTTVVDEALGRTQREVVADNVPCLSDVVDKAATRLGAIDRTMSEMRALLGQGEKNAEKLRIESALTPAVARQIVCQ